MLDQNLMFRLENASELPPITYVEKCLDVLASATLDRLFPNIVLDVNITEGSFVEVEHSLDKTESLIEKLESKT
jgi:hypothetical protein